MWIEREEGGGWRTAVLHERCACWLARATQHSNELVVMLLELVVSLLLAPFALIKQNKWASGSRLQTSLQFTVGSSKQARQCSLLHIDYSLAVQWTYQVLKPSLALTPLLLSCFTFSSVDQQSQVVFYFLSLSPLYSIAICIQRRRRPDICRGRELDGQTKGASFSLTWQSRVINWLLELKLHPQHQWQLLSSSLSSLLTRSTSGNRTQVLLKRAADATARRSTIHEGQIESNVLAVFFFYFYHLHCLLDLQLDYREVQYSSTAKSSFY